MTCAQTSLLAPTASDERAEETDTAERCDDPTPRGVIRAALGQLFTQNTVDPKRGRKVTHLETRWFRKSNGLNSRGFFCVDDAPLRVLDVGAGYGAWSSEMRRLAQRQGWPVHITGVELKAERERYLRRWCDEVWIDDWDPGSRPASAGEGPCLWQGDLAIGNPPFDELTGPKGAKRPPEECMPAVLLRHAPAVLLLHTQQAFLKSEAGRASWRHTPPAASWLVPGGVKFRGPHVGADSRCYEVTLWLRDHTGPCSVYMLDDMSAADRQWVVPPGTEQPSMCGACDGDGYTTRWSRDTNTVEAADDCPDCGGSGLDPHGDLPAAPGRTP
jgi:hypothetical protein